MILHRVVSSPLQVLAYLRPLVAKLRVLLKDSPFLILRDWILGNMALQMVMVSLSALFACSSFDSILFFQFSCHSCPIQSLGFRLSDFLNCIVFFLTPQLPFNLLHFLFLLKSLTQAFRVFGYLFVFHLFKFVIIDDGNKL